MEQFPQLYGENGWSMIWRPEPNVRSVTNGPKLCSLTFGHMAKCIENIARAFADEPRQPQLGDPVR